MFYINIHINTMYKDWSVFYVPANTV